MASCSASAAVRHQGACVLVWGLMSGLLLSAPAHTQEPLPVLPVETRLIEAPIEVEEGQRWEREVPLPALGAGQVPVLFVRARIPLGGGGNFVLRVRLDGVPLRDNWFAPRLLNKAPHFDPPGTDYHFVWYRDVSWNQSYAWFTCFNQDPQGNWAGTGQDYDYLFDLSGLVRGPRVRLAIEHNFPGLAAALKVERAPLLVERLQLGVLPSVEVQRLRQAVLGGVGIVEAPVQPQVPAGETGQQAYELTWSGRPDPGLQVTFEDLSQWTVQSLGESGASLTASVRQRLWRPRVGRLEIPKGDRPVNLALRPKAPIPLGGPFDGLNFWVYGHKHFMQPDATPIQCRALLADANGAEVVVDLGPIRMGYWMLLHGYLPPAQLSERALPLSFKALLLNADKAKADYTLYLEGIHAYARNRHPQGLGRPEKPVFPRNDDGLLPTPPAGVQTAAAGIPGGACFTATSPAGRLVYEVRPDQGCLDGITARWNDGTAFQPCAGGGLEADDRRAVAGTVADSSLEGQHLVARWTGPQGQRWQADYSLRGQSLVVSLQAEGDWAGGTGFGEVAGLAGPKAIEVPYLNFARAQNMTHVAAGSGLFVSVLPDFYHSDYSAIDGAVTPASPERLRLFSRTIYTPLTDGRRNALRDRLLITASPEFADVLPNHQNPPSPNLARLAPYMFVMGRAFHAQRWADFKRYGLDHVIANDFAGVLVKDYSEGFGVRWRPHPDYTIEQVQAARRHIRDLGFLFGFYIDVTDFYPLNEFWDENLLALTAEGDLREAWPGSYAPKNDAMWVLARKTGQKVKELYPADCVYLDVSTNRGSEAIDYEAGVPGAGMVRQAVIGVGDSLVEARQWYGSTVSEGIFRWMYAGLSDMDYAQVKMKEPMPLPLDFDLLKIHPFQIGTMMGYGPTCSLTPDEVKELGTSHEMPAPKAFYKHVGTSLAYGHMALLGYGYFPPMQRSIHYYALMQGLQKEYLPDQAAAISYHDGTRFLPTSQALLADAHRRGRVRVEYRGGLVVTVNLNPEEPWTVAQADREFVLPPYGWIASRTRGEPILAYSASVDGQRLDYVQCPDYVYLNSGDRPRRVGPLEVTGAAWLKRQERGWLLIPCGKLGHWSADNAVTDVPADRGCPLLVVDPAALGLKALTATAVADDGAIAAVTPKALPDGRLQFTVTAQTQAFRLSAVP